MRYLTDTRDGRGVDPVANFHLTNGASLERVNWLANPEPYGIAESFGVMVNYRYDRSKMAGNAGAYLGRGEVRTSNQVRVARAHGQELIVGHRRVRVTRDATGAPHSGPRPVP